MPGPKLRFSRRILPTLEQQTETNGRLQGVFQVVIAQVNRRIIRTPPQEKTLDITKDPGEEGQARTGVHPGELAGDERRNRGRVFGVNGRKHGRCWRKI
jgi:hypothetical protein